MSNFHIDLFYISWTSVAVVQYMKMQALGTTIIGKYVSCTCKTLTLHILVILHLPNGNALEVLPLGWQGSF